MTSISTEVLSVIYDDSQQQTIRIVALVNTILSTVGFLFIFASFVFVGELRKKPAFRMVFNLSIVDTLMCLVGLINVDAHALDQAHHNVCIGFGFVLQFTSLSSAVWVVMFAYTLFQFFVKRNENLESIERLNYVVCYGIPMIAAIIPFFTDAYGSAVIYCWFPNEYSKHGLFLFYLPVIVIFFVMVYFYVRIISTTYKQAMNKKDLKIVYQFALYPCGLVLNFFFAGLNRFYNFPYADGKIFWIVVCHVAFQQCQTLINALIYASNHTVRSKITKKCKNMCQTRKPSGDDSSYYSIQNTFVRASEYRQSSKGRNTPSNNSNAELWSHISDRVSVL